jgi:hypothetical protein
MDGPFDQDMRNLICAVTEGDHSEVEFCAYRVHRSAKALGRIEVANAAADVVAAYRIVGAGAARCGPLDVLARMTNWAIPE